MAYTNIWDDTKPTGAEAANTIDDLMRSGKVDLEQRFNDIFAMPNFTDDPLRPYGLKFTDVQDAKIFFGDNGGTPRNILFRNKADATTFVTIGANTTINSGNFTVSNGTTTINGATTITLVSGSNNILTAHANFAGTYYGLFIAQQSGATKWAFGLNSGEFALVNAALNAENLHVTDAGLLTVRGGITLGAGSDLNLAGGGFGITNGATRFFQVPSGGAPMLTITNGITVSASGITVTGVSKITAAGGTLILDALSSFTSLQLSQNGAIKGFVGIDKTNGLTAGSSDGDLVLRAETGQFFRFSSAGSLLGSITNVGLLLWGTTASTGASGGDIVIANANYIRGVFSGTAYKMVGIDANSVLQLGDGSSGIYPAIARAVAPATNVNLKGILIMDTVTAGQITYFDGVTGARYKVIGTAF
jgi:hypothetical protein